MAQTSSLLRVPVEMPDRSGHNLSHSNSFTGTTGTLIPVLCEELLPNDTISLGSQLQVQLPPMVTDFYGRVDFVLEAFFVPNRLCWGGWQDFITHPTANPVYPVGTPSEAKPTLVPYFTSSDLMKISPFENPLLHYLDYGMDYQTGSGINSRQLSMLPAIAYHRIWHDWYRDSRVQSPIFYRSSSLTGDPRNALSSLPFIGTPSATGAYNVPAPSTTFIDGVKVSALRQRNWVKDYFTSASPLPQAGSASEVSFTVANNEGAFSISTLRAANSLNLWRLS